MAATQYSDYYNNYVYQHHHQSQPQNVYATGQYDCRNLNVNDAYRNYDYNSPNNYNDQWSQHYSTISSAHQHHQTQPQHHHQPLNMLNNQINDDYKNYSHHGYNNSATSKAIPTEAHHHSSNGRNEHQPNLNCNQYVDAKNDLFYGQQQTAPISVEINGAIAAAHPSSQLAQSTKKRKIDNADDSPALRALLTKPKRAKHSPYFYHSQGSISPASSTDNYPQHYQVPSVPVATADEQLVNLNHYAGSITSVGYETTIDDVQAKACVVEGKFCAASRFAPSEATNSPMSSFMENISTPPTSPKDGKNDESSDNLLWCEQNGGLCDFQITSKR